MTDSVCDIVGQWEPETRESAKEYLRRNYDTLWNSALWTESIIIADAAIDARQRQVVLPYLFDRVLEVRTNEGGPLTQITRLQNAELPYLLNVSKDIFEQSGEPVFYNVLPSIATQNLSYVPEKIQAISSNAAGLTHFGQIDHEATDDGAEIFIKGEREGVEIYEVLRLPAGSFEFPYTFTSRHWWALGKNTYDVITTISKPGTNRNINFFGTSTRKKLLVLRPEETERKHVRIEIHPNFGENGLSIDNHGDSTAGTVLVCGKRRLSPMVEDRDSPQIAGVSNILIAAAAGDLFDKMGKSDMAAKFQQKAASLTQILIKGETEQAAHQPKIVPYTEGFSSRRPSLTWFP